MDLVRFPDPPYGEPDNIGPSPRTKPESSLSINHNPPRPYKIRVVQEGALQIAKMLQTLKKSLIKFAKR